MEATRQILIYDIRIFFVEAPECIRSFHKENSEFYDQYLLCRFLQQGAPFLGNGILASYTFRNYHKKLRSLQSIFALSLPFQSLLPMYILSSLQGALRGSSIFGQWDFGFCYIQKLSQKNSEAYNEYLLRRFHFSYCSELLVGSSRRELHFRAMGSGLLIHSGAFTKKILRFMINICSVASILVIAPYVNIELPVGSSRRELHFWAMGFWLIIHSEVITKKIRSLRLIFALSLPF